MQHSAPAMADITAQASSRPDPGAAASSSTSVDLNEAGPSSFRPSPSPSITSQSDDPDRDDEEDDEEDAEEDDFTDVVSPHFTLKDRRNTLKARGSAALVPKVSSSDTWNISPATAQNASAATLPHEILLHIFRYVATDPQSLRSSLRVCKAWCLCGVELLWHRPSLQRISNLFQLIHIIRRSDQTFPYASFIRRMNLSLLANDLEDSLFGRLSVCNRLERLTLTGCTQISDEMIGSVVANCKHLVAADFSEVHQLTDATVFAIAQNCPRLQGINLTGCKQVTSASVAALAKNCKLMRRVKLCNCELVGDEALSTLAEHCPVLLEVDLINCPLISDKSVRKIWQYSFHMRELRLAQCGKLTDLAFPAPPSSLAHAGTYTIAGAASMANSAPASRGASPMGFQTGARPGYATSSEALPTSMMMPDAPVHTHLRAGRLFDHLRILDLTNCSTISDASIEGIVSNVPRLRNLILAKCTRLTNESAYSIARLGKNLHYLHLGHVSNLTDRAVCHLARSCTRLRYIDLACCLQLTDLSVIELAANLPKLRRIGLVRVSNLTDQAIYSLVERYTSLERIHLSYCENITVPAIFWLLERLSRLTHLSLTGVPEFRHPDLQRMRREPPKEFNAHQRAAFCVYSGKGVHELRKFLQQAYSQNKPMFRELRPEVQAYWHQATANQNARRLARQQFFAQQQQQGGHVMDVHQNMHVFHPAAQIPIGNVPMDRRDIVQEQVQPNGATYRTYIANEQPGQYAMLATSAPPAIPSPLGQRGGALYDPMVEDNNASRSRPTGGSNTGEQMPGATSTGTPTFPNLHSLQLPMQGAGSGASIWVDRHAPDTHAGSGAHNTPTRRFDSEAGAGQAMAALATPPAPSGGSGGRRLPFFSGAMTGTEDGNSSAPGLGAGHPRAERSDGSAVTDAHGDDVFVNADDGLDAPQQTPTAQTDPFHRATQYFAPRQGRDEASESGGSGT